MEEQGEQSKAEGEPEAIGDAFVVILKRRVLQEPEHDIDIREIGHGNIGPQRRPAIGLVLPYCEAIEEITRKRMGDRGGHRQLYPYTIDVCRWGLGRVGLPFRVDNRYLAALY